MLIILISIITTIAGQPTNSFIEAEHSNYRSFIPVVDVNYTYNNSNGHQLPPMFSYSMAYDNVKKISDAVLHSYGSSAHRPVVSYNPQYPNGNRYEQGNRQAEAVNPSTRLPSDIYEQNIFDYVKQQITQKPKPMVQEYNNYTQYNRPESNSRKNTTQLEQVITDRINKTKINLTTTERLNIKVNTSTQYYLNNNSNIDQSSTNHYYNSVKNVKDENNGNSSETNMFIVEENSNTRNNNTTILNNNNINTNRRDKETLGTKTPQDNEVGNSYESESNANSDKWIWTNGEIETTTLMTLDDRAAFSGNNCPTGTVRFQDRCVPID